MRAIFLRSVHNLGIRQYPPSLQPHHDRLDLPRTTCLRSILLLQIDTMVVLLESGSAGRCRDLCCHGCELQLRVGDSAFTNKFGGPTILLLVVSL